MLLPGKSTNIPGVFYNFAFGQHPVFVSIYVVEYILVRSGESPAKEFVELSSCYLYRRTLLPAILSRLLLLPLPPLLPLPLGLLLLRKGSFRKGRGSGLQRTERIFMFIPYTVSRGNKIPGTRR